MRADDLLVKELREEHRDREWVDNGGGHWMWCEGQWMTQVVDYEHTGCLTVNGRSMKWAPVTDAFSVLTGVTADCAGWYQPDPEPHKSRGPFMDGIHYRITRGS